MSVHVRAPQQNENAWIERYLSQSWGSTTVVSRGVAHDASRLPALLALQGEEIVGLATFRFADEARRIKPSIPLIGEHDIPIHDELELELALD